MKNNLLFDGFIDILGNQIGIKIYKEEDGEYVMYSFTQSLFLQDKSDAMPYRPGSGSMSDSLEGILSKIRIYKGRFREVIKTEDNPDF